MPNRTLQDLVLWTQDFHRKMHENLQQAAQQTQNERARMLLTYLAEHEQRLEEMLGRFNATAASTALNTWVSDYKEQFPPSEHDHRDQPYAIMSTSEIMNELHEQHGRMIARYQNLKDFVQSSAAELVQQIIELEEQEMLRMSQSANRLEDI